jgi:hypothetical protein
VPRRSCSLICRWLELPAVNTEEKQVERNKTDACLLGLALELVQSHQFAKIVREIADNCANLQSSFETDWFLRRLFNVGPDLDLAANSSVLIRKLTKWNREQ